MENFDMEEYLSNEEKYMLNTLNKGSNYLQDKYIDKQDFLNNSLSDIYTQWSRVMKEILNEVIIYISNIRNYTTYFTDIDNSSLWWKGLIKAIRELISIFIKDGRAIYFGITIIVLSLMLFVIGITS